VTKKESGEKFRILCPSWRPRTEHTKIQSSSGNFSKHSNFDWSFDTTGLYSQQELHSRPYEPHLFTRN
jgi:hypothetical protein